MFDLTGKVALVTGASSGIGYAAAKVLAQQGAKVAIAARRKDRLDKLAVELGSMSREAMPVVMDVTSPTQITAGIDKIIQVWGNLDILVNNAGVVETTPFLEMTEAQWDKTLDTNLKGYFLVAQAAAREMAKNKWGRIINISSIAMGGVGVGFPGITHYCASKGGVVAFTEALADELASSGILVNCIAPGIIKSEMTTDIEKNPGQLTGMLTRVPIKRMGTPEEIAAAIVYFASNESSYTTGSTLVVDGGWLAS